MKDNKQQKVYLSGGFRGDWQEVVKYKAKGFDYIDPKEKELGEFGRMLTPKEYALWDLHFIKNCDILFAYVDVNNTSCIGLSVEVGYAKGLGKTVITVLEKNHKTIKDSYLEFVGHTSDIVFSTLDEGINYLNLFGKL
jgi:nucleoside 2-deoxyribosyltransferase